MGASLILNGLGIHIFQVLKKGNKNQHLLLKNFAGTEVAKAVYDLIALSLHYFYENASKQLAPYLFVTEINFMTIVYFSFISVNMDRLLCIILKEKYTKYIKTSTAQKAICCMWIGSALPGFFLLLIFGCKSKANAYYYIVWDTIVVVVIVVTYILVINKLHGKTRSSSGESKRKAAKKKRSLNLAILLTTAFMVCNVIPNIVILFLSNGTTYYAMAVLWSTGYLVDPLLYIFAAKRSRKTAKSIFKKLLRQIPRHIINDV